MGVTKVVKIEPDRPIQPVGLRTGPVFGSISP